MVIRISHSAARSFVECERKWWLAHIRRVEQVTTPALEHGTLVHNAIADEKIAADSGLEEVSARALAYLDGETILGHELKLTMPITEGIELVGRLDVLSRDESRRLVVTDWKTGRIITPRDQLVTYAILVKHHYGRWPLLRAIWPVDDVTIDVPYTRREVDARWAHLVETADRMRQSTGAPNPGRWCSWCTVRTHCDQWGGDDDPV
jgi:hypothetical protein